MSIATSAGGSARTWYSVLPSRSDSPGTSSATMYGGCWSSPTL
jgi:hypothetical protein